jgi:c-di-GMP-binding flagellar brake protein YcgR
MIENLSKVQRREDVRVDSNLPLLYTNNKFLLRLELNDENPEEIILNNKKYFNKGWISDLSAGGIRFSCERNYHMDTVLLLVFNLEYDTIITKGQIVYKSSKVTPKKTFYVYGIKFIDIDDEKREKIISYNFVVMRKNRLGKRG